ncbi:hypothetical protein TCON_2333 [Astathelohania contejeani]|uniref:Uncharacterized protein n=1 Tax=Astathelohania contejeani TaxID=164912 RepID=A0ABQ7HWE5_9MICR|nr:hypothetical protein TCON_2333 [Thelohania contejeani]
MLSISRSIIKNTDIEYMEATRLKIKTLENYEYAIKAENVKFEKILKNKVNNEESRLDLKEKKWIILLIEVLTTAKYRDAFSVYNLFEIIGKNLYLLAYINDNEFLGELNKKILNMFNRLIINENRVNPNEKCDIYNEFYDQMKDSLINMKNYSFECDLEKSELFFNKHMLILLTSVFYFTGNYKVSMKYIRYWLSTEYLAFMFKINLKESIKLLVVETIFSDKKNIPFLYMISTNYKNDNLLTYTILKMIISNKMDRDVMIAVKDMVLIKNIIIPTDCEYIATAIRFYFDYNALQSLIRKYFHKNEDELFDFYIHLIVCDSEIGDNKEFRYRIIEYLFSKKLNESILNFTNNYILSICKSITSICDVIKDCNNINISYYLELFDTLFTMIYRTYFFSIEQTPLSREECKNILYGIIKKMFSKDSISNNSIMLTLFIDQVNTNLHVINFRKLYLFIMNIIFSQKEMLQWLNDVKSEFIMNKDIYICIAKIMSLVFILRNEMIEHEIYIFKECYYMDFQIVKFFEFLIAKKEFVIDRLYCRHLSNCLANYKKEIDNKCDKNIISVHDFLEGKELSDLTAY